MPFRYRGGTSREDVTYSAILASWIQRSVSFRLSERISVHFWHCLACWHGKIGSALRFLLKGFSMTHGIHFLPLPLEFFKEYFQSLIVITFFKFFCSSGQVVQFGTSANQPAALPSFACLMVNESRSCYRSAERTEYP